MSHYRLAISICLALSAPIPAAAATVFWPFGFHFPDRARHHAGGLSAEAQPERATETAETQASPTRNLQIAMLTDVPPAVAYNVSAPGDEQAVRASVPEYYAGGEYIGN